MYQVFEIPVGAAETTEQLGTKFKFWYRNADHQLNLFKEGRPGTGENWAEKIACELAKLIGLPHAQYEFATYEGKEGVICPTLVESGARLIHGNEILASFVTEYAPHHPKVYHQREHTIQRVLSYFRASAGQLGAPYGFTEMGPAFGALEVFIGYLMFDTWIANQDRHDQNWGLLRSAEGNNFLAPSYDHGSSMGRNESDEARSIKMNTRDKGLHISKYVTMARSAFYSSTDGKVKSLPTLDAFIQAARQNPSAAESWRHKISDVRTEDIVSIFDKIPAALMTQTSRTFTLELLKLNRLRILNCEID